MIPIGRRKIVLVGKEGSGKTTFVERILKGYFNPKYDATLGVSINNLPNTLKYIWDCAGQDKFSGLGEEYWKNADFFIIMIDCTTKNSLYFSYRLFTRIRELYYNAHVIFCLNKIDSIDKCISINDIIDEPNTSKFEISVKMNFNCTEVIQFLYN